MIRSIRGIARGEPARRDRGSRESRGENRSGPVAEQRGGRTLSELVGRDAARSQQRSVALLEGFRARQMRRAKGQAERAVRTAGGGESPDVARAAVQGRLRSRVVRVLATAQPPSRARRMAAGATRSLREAREREVAELTRAGRRRRSLLQSQARQAYGETLGARSDLP